MGLQKQANDEEPSDLMTTDEWWTLIVDLDAPALSPEDKDRALRTIQNGATLPGEEDQNIFSFSEETIDEEMISRWESVTILYGEGEENLPIGEKEWTGSYQGPGPSWYGFGGTPEELVNEFKVWGTPE